jgi:cytochrome c oxidase assembly protein subunit 15
MRLYKRFALLSVLATYFLIYMGGLVRVSGAGLGCPDWPKCFGRWIPPLNPSQLPPEFAAESFNFTLAWIEYINRLIGVLVGLFILVTAILAIIYFRKKLSVLVPSLLAALLVAYQGWQGSQVVASELEPIIVSIHMVIAFVIISLLIYAALQAHFVDITPGQIGMFPKSTSLFVVILWLGTILQVLLGTQVRGAIEHAIREYPLLFGAELLDKVGTITRIHMSTGIIFIIALVAVSWFILAKSRDISNLVRQTTWGLLIVSVAQLVVGHFLIFVGLPEIVQLLHLWLSSLMIGALLVLYVSTRKGGRIDNV